VRHRHRSLHPQAPDARGACGATTVGRGRRQRVSPHCSPDARLWRLCPDQRRLATVACTAGLRTETSSTARKCLIGTIATQWQTIRHASSIEAVRRVPTAGFYVDPGGVVVAAPLGYEGVHAAQTSRYTLAKARGCSALIGAIPFVVPKTANADLDRWACPKATFLFLHAFSATTAIPTPLWTNPADFPDTDRIAGPQVCILTIETPRRAGESCIGTCGIDLARRGSSVAATCRLAAASAGTRPVATRAVATLPCAPHAPTALARKEHR
jgi:hypothetical protein